MDELRNRMKKTKERINKLEDRKIEIIQSEQMRNRLKKKKTNKSSEICGAIIQDLKFMSSDSQKERIGEED